MKKSSGSLFATLLMAFTAASGLAQLPTITSGPQDPKGRQNPIVEDGHPNCSLSLSITASGPGPLNYVWKRGTAVVGNNSPSLILSPSTLAMAGSYTCEVSNFAGKVVSSPSRVTVININDSIIMAAAGTSTTAFSVNAVAPTGTTLQYRWWQRQSDGTSRRLISSDSPKFSGVNTKTLTISNLQPSDAAFYYCQVFANGFSMNSGERRLIVIPAPTSKIVAAGDSTELEVLPVGASQSIYEQMSFQWKKGTATLTDETSSILSFPEVTSTSVADYRCDVTLNGVTVTSPAARLDLVATSEVVYLSRVGQTSQKMKMTASAATARALQWFNEQNEALVNGVHFAGVTTDTLEIKGVTLEDAGGYYCRVTAYDTSVNSGVQRLIVAAAPNSKLVTLGETFALEFEPAGSTIEVSSRFAYQWKKGTSLISGEINNIYSGPASTALTDAGKYSCILTYTPEVGSPLVIESPTALVSVVNPAASTLLVAEGKSSKFTTQVSGEGMTFQWFKDGSTMPLSSSAKYAGVTTPEISINQPGLDQGGEYVCRVSAFGQSVDSEIDRLVVVSRPANVLVDAGDELNLTILTSGEATPADLSFEWFKGSSSIPGASGPTFNIPEVSLSDAGKYTCKVTYSGALSITTALTDVSVVDKNGLLLLGLAGGKTALTVSTRGTGMTYQWFRGNDTVPMTDIAGKYKGAAKDVLEVLALTNADSGDYRCEVSAFGRLVQIGFRTLEIVTTPPSQLFAAGEPLSLEAATTSTITDLNYVWRKGTSIVAGQTTSEFNLTAAALSDAADYTCSVSIPGGMSVVTGKATVSVVNLSSFNVNVANAASAKIKVPTAGKNLIYSWSRLEGGTKTPLTEGTKYVGVNKQEVRINSCAASDAGTYVCDISMTGASATFTTSPISLSVVLPYMSGNFTALIDRTDLMGAVNGGLVNLTVASTGAVTGRLFLGAQSFPFTGVLEGTSPSTGIATASIVVTRTAGNLLLDFSLGSDNLLTGGTLSDNVDTISFTGWRNSFLQSSTATGYAGVYNLGLGLPLGSIAIGDVSIPQGSGYSSFTVSTKGEYAMAGRTADGQAITASSFVGPSGQALFYQALYATIGPATVLGSFTIDSKSNATPSDNTLAGTASWNRPFDPSDTQRTYKAGFEPVALAVEGSFYAAPVSPLVFLNLTASSASNNAALTFVDGGIGSASSTTVNALTPRAFRIGSASAVAIPSAALPAQLKLTLTAGKGEFKGDFVLADGTVSRPKTTYQGLVYQKGANLVGVGYFLHDRGTAFNILSGAVFMDKVP